ncbi:unnamed protein product, partial [Prorocentrum cordatum]
MVAPRAAPRTCPGLPPHVPGAVQGRVHAELVHLELGGSAMRDLQDCGVVGVLEWWGQDGNDPAVPRLLPQNFSAPAEGGAYSAAFPLRCSPAKFSAYLGDMGVLSVRLDRAAGAAALVGVCEADVAPWLTGSDLRMDAQLPVFRGPGDRAVIGQLRLRLRTEWPQTARWRPEADVLSSFERNERLVEEDEGLRQRPRPPAAREAPVASRMPAEAPMRPPRPAEGAAAFPAEPAAVAPVPRAAPAPPQAAEPPATRTAALPVHLRVWLGSVRLRAASLAGVRAVFRLGASQEVSAWVQREAAGGAAPAGETCGVIAQGAVSSEPVWQLGALVSGPAPKTVHVQFWQGPDQGPSLIGLASLAVPMLSLNAAQDIWQQGRATLLETEADVCSLDSGGAVGAVQVFLAAGRTAVLARPSSPRQRPASWELGAARERPAAAGPKDPEPGSQAEGAPARSAEALAAAAPSASAAARADSALAAAAAEVDEAAAGEAAASWRRAQTAGELWLAAADERALAALLASAGCGEAPGAAEISLLELRRALLQHLGGLSEQEATALCSLVAGVPAPPPGGGPPGVLPASEAAWRQVLQRGGHVAADRVREYLQ